MVTLLLTIVPGAVPKTFGRMTKLPPGFTHELQQHVHQPGHGFYDEVKGVPILDFDKFCCGRWHVLTGLTNVLMSRELRRPWLCSPHREPFVEYGCYNVLVMMV
jgi:hypothetical protein